MYVCPTCETSVRKDTYDAYVVPKIFAQEKRIVKMREMWQANHQPSRVQG